MRPPSFALGGFEAPLNQSADVALLIGKIKSFWWLGRRPIGIERFIKPTVVIRTNGRHGPTRRQLSVVLVNRKSYFASREVVRRGSAHSVLPGENDHRIRTELVLLPLDFQFHLCRRFATRLDDVLDGERGLGREPFATCTGGAEFAYEFGWHFPPPSEYQRTMEAASRIPHRHSLEQGGNSRL